MKHISLKRTILSLLLLACTIAVSAQDILDSIAFRALQVGQVMQQERVYLHFDNTAYYLGETMWFKAYVSFGADNRPSRLSKVLYVELVAPEGYVVKTNKYKIGEDGTCHGEFELNPLLLSGYYEVRAYTRYMLNWDKSAIFSRVFPVFDKVHADSWDFKNMLDRKRSFPKNGEWISAELPEASLEFFPESGHLVAGIECRVAYELRGVDGLFGEEKITIFEEKKPIIETTPRHMGKGSFRFTPKTGVKYHAEVTMENSKGKLKKHKFHLPQIQDKGVVLSVNENGSNICVEISNTLPSGQELGFVILNRGTMGYYRKLDNTVKNLAFAKDSLREGVNRAVIFADSVTPLAERQFFVEHDSIMSQDMGTAKLHVTANGYLTDNASLTPNQKITLRVKREDGKPITEESNLSMSVRDAIANQQTSYSHNMYTYMLLGSELKGFIPDAAQYFDQENKMRKEHLDLVMLTHGWTSYDWELLTRTDINDFHLVERGITLKGRFIRKVLDRRFAHLGEFSLIPQKYILTRMDISIDRKTVEMSTFRTDSTGTFIIEIPDFYGTTIASLNPQDVMKNSENISYHYILDRYYSPGFRQYDHWERHLGKPMSKNEADSLVKLNPFDYMLSSVDVVARKNKETHSRPPHSEMRFNYLEEWEYASDMMYLNLWNNYKDELFLAVRDKGIDGINMSEEDNDMADMSFYENPNTIDAGHHIFCKMSPGDSIVRTRYIGCLRFSTDGILTKRKNFIPVKHSYNNILTANEVVLSAMRRHNYNWAYWVQLMVVLGEYNQEEVPQPDMEYLRGTTNPEKMTAFKEFVIRSDEKTRQQFENRQTHWQPLSYMMDNKVPAQRFYRGFLSQSYLHAPNGIDGCPDIASFMNMIFTGTGVDYPINPNYVACMIPYTEEEKAKGVVPDYTATSSMRYTAIQGYSESKKFYSPDYGKMKPQEKDYRRTLLWEPTVKIENGEAIIELYNSSTCNNIIVEIEGRDGNTILSNYNLTKTRTPVATAKKSETAETESIQENVGKETPLDSATLAACAYQHEKGLIYYNMRRYKDAITIFAELAQYRYAPSMYYIALCYINGTGLKKNDRLACSFMIEAAKRGEPKAQYDLSVMLRQGRIVAKDINLSQEWYAKALDNGEPRALMETAYNYRDKGMLTEAKELIKKAALQEYPEGLYAYGIILIEEGLDGTGHIRSAADMKHPDAMDWIADYEYRNKNYKASYRMAQELHLLGDHRGTKRMADCYYEGKGIGRDKGTAIDLYMKAANAGNEEAKEAMKKTRK